MVYWAGKDFFVGKALMLQHIASREADESTAEAMLLSQLRPFTGEKEWVPLPENFCERSYGACKWLRERDSKVSLIALAAQPAAPVLPATASASE